MTTETMQVARALTHKLLETYPGDAAEDLNAYDASDILMLLDSVPVTQAVAVFLRLNADVAVRVIEEMDKIQFVQFFSTIESSRAATLLARMADVDDWLSLLSPSLVNELRELMLYPPDSAGSLMDTQVTTCRTDASAGEVLDHIRTITGRRILTVQAVDDQGFLKGVIPLQEVAVAPLHTKIMELAPAHPVSIASTAPKDEVVDLLEQKKLASIPVVDFDGRLLGIIRYDALVSAAQEDATENLQAMVGAGREERALSKASLAIWKRLPWLEINLGTAFLAAAVVGLFQDTIAQYTALAILLPVVAGQSGNTGAQALAVTMRGLALREIRLKDGMRVIRKEVLVGFVNGCAVGLTTAFFVFIFMGPGLALVIGVSMVVSMACAGLAGAAVPLVLTSLRQDPAQSASIVLTTVTDVIGFFSFLGFATLLIRFFNMSL